MRGVREPKAAINCAQCGIEFTPRLLTQINCGDETCRWLAKQKLNRIGKEREKDLRSMSHNSGIADRGWIYSGFREDDPYVSIAPPILSCPHQVCRRYGGHHATHCPTREPQYV